MASTLYATIFERAEARGRLEAQTNTIIRALTRKAGALDEDVAMRIRSMSNLETVDAWLDEALDLTDADSARRLIEKITQALPPM